MSASIKKKLRKEQNAAVLTEKQLAEQKEAKKLKAYTTTFVAVIALVVVAALVVACVTGFLNSGILQRNNDAVTIGDTTLTNADLNYFYVDNIQSNYNTWHESYGENTQLFVQWLQGLDISKPLNEQVQDTETGATFADYYKDLAIESAKSVYAIYNLAKAAGETLTAEQESELESAIQTTSLYASLYGFSDPVDYLKAMYGPGATMENYRNYLEVKTVATHYAQKQYDAIEVSDADIAARNKENFDEFSTFDYAVFYVDVNDFLPCREEETADDHKHSEEELAVAREAAKKAAEELVASGATDTLLLDAAISKSEAYKHNEDAKSATRTGYALSKVSAQQGEWLKAADRQVGDLGMVASETTSTDAEGNETSTLNGYNIMLFLGRNDNEQKLVNVRHILASFKGGTTDSSGKTTYSEEEKKGALEIIEAVKAEWLANGGTEEAFIALVKDHTDDTGSKDTEGLYEDVYPGQMVTAFNDWCFAEERKAGDYEIVETEYGYHLMYFVSHSDTTYREMQIEDVLREEAYTKWYDAQIEAVTVTELNTEYLSRDYVIAG